MVTWQEAHFVGGHPVFDLANTVFDRLRPVDDVELLRTPADLATWCVAVGLVEEPPEVDEDLVAEVRVVRALVWAVYDAIARGEPVPADPFGALFERAGSGLRAGQLEPERGTPASPRAIPAALAVSAIRASFTLPRERVRACGRCGWLFLDSSRGGRRRWCSMSVCGNREKASRHRQASPSSG